MMWINAERGVVMFPYFILMLDTVPDYIQKTFGIDEDGRFPSGSAMQVIREGEDLPADMEFAVILYNDDEYHASQVFHLARQVMAVSPGAKVMWLPVRG